MKNLGDFLKNNNIIRVTPDDSLSEALGQLSSSHDAAFVFDESDVFHGVVNPYYSLIQSSAYDGNTKVTKALFHPPKIKSSDTLERIAAMMVSSKVHYLPVFGDDDSFVGITSARRLVSLMRDTVQNIRVSQIISGKNRPLVVIDENQTIAEALQIFQKEKVSKLIVTESQGKLTGILSHYDLIPYIIAPGDRKDQEKGFDKGKPFEKLLVKNYMKKMTLTLDATSPVSEVIDIIIEHEIGSVVITDSSDRPVGIVTTRDILELLKSEGETKEVKLSMKNFNPAHKIVIDELADHVMQHIMLDGRYTSAEIVTTEEKEGVLFRISIYLLPEKGKMTVFERESKDLPSLLKDLKELLRRDKA